MSHSRHPRWYLLAAAMLAGLIGYYGPWVPHRAAGLAIIGLDLAEYVKFLPQVRSGQILFPRELFYLPLFAASLGCSMLASRRSLHPVLRAICALAAVPLALAMLPPAWTPAVLRSAEFRLQVIAIAICLAAVPASLLARHLRDRCILAFLAILALAAAVFPSWAFLQVKTPIEALYNRALPLGWGFWLNMAGFLAAAAVAASEAVRQKR